MSFTVWHNIITVPRYWLLYAIAHAVVALRFPANFLYNIPEHVLQISFLFRLVVALEAGVQILQRRDVN